MVPGLSFILGLEIYMAIRIFRPSTHRPRDSPAVAGRQVTIFETLTIEAASLVGPCGSLIQDALQSSETGARCK